MKHECKDDGPTDEEIDEFWKSLDRQHRWDIYRKVIEGEKKDAIKKSLNSKLCTYCFKIMEPPEADMCMGDHLFGWRCSSEECSEAYKTALCKQAIDKYNL